jgi:signal transduction histidine kinase
VVATAEVRRRGLRSALYPGPSPGGAAGLALALADAPHDLPALVRFVEERAARVLGTSVTVRLDGEPGTPPDGDLVLPLAVLGRRVGTMVLGRSRLTVAAADGQRPRAEEVAAVVALAVAAAAATRPRGPNHERLAALGQMAAGLAHDVNNAVSAIKLYAELLDTESALDGPAREHLHAIRVQADRAIALAWETLSASHRRDRDLDDLDLVAFVEEFADLTRPLFPTGVRITVEQDAPAHLILGEPAMLQQILTNVAANARQAIGETGSLTLRVAGVDVRPGEEPLDGMVPGAWVRLDVADSGCGIPPEVLDRVFEPFFSTKPAGRGTGLGLTQVLALVTEHDGHVSIASAPGEGTTVSLWFPADTPAHTHPRSARPDDDQQEPEPGRDEVVLVVEDDADLRAALADVLRSLGYQARAVADGEQALEVLERTTVDAVVSDVSMPGLGGEGLARRIAERWPGIPVILTSAHPQARAAAPGGASRAIRLRKPFSSRQVARALRAVLDPVDRP